MQEFQKRVVTEKQELDEKLSKLRLFIDSSTMTFQALDADEKERLKAQSVVMEEYSNILGDRILHFK